MSQLTLQHHLRGIERACSSISATNATLSTRLSSAEASSSNYMVQLSAANHHITSIHNDIRPLTTAANTVIERYNKLRNERSEWKDKLQCCICLANVKYPMMFPCNQHYACAVCVRSVMNTSMILYDEPEKPCTFLYRCPMNDGAVDDSDGVVNMVPPAPLMRDVIRSLMPHHPTTCPFCHKENASFDHVATCKSFMTKCFYAPVCTWTGRYNVADVHLQDCVEALRAIGFNPVLIHDSDAEEMHNEIPNDDDIAAIDAHYAQQQQQPAEEAEAVPIDDMDVDIDASQQSENTAEELESAMKKVTDSITAQRAASLPPLSMPPMAAASSNGVPIIDVTHTDDDEEEDALIEQRMSEYFALQHRVNATTTASNTSYMNGGNVANDEDDDEEAVVESSNDHSIRHSSRRRRTSRRNRQNTNFYHLEFGV